MAWRPTTLRIVIALSSTLLLAGCTPGAEMEPEASSGSSDAAAPSAEAGGGAVAARPLPSVTIAPEPVITADPVPATGVCEISYVDAATAGTIGGLDIEVVRDRGPRLGASGETTTLPDGTPASYLVAEGDISELIAERFCVSPDYLDILNSVRRDGVGIDDLFAGDTVNLSPSTVLSVGDQNGRVLDNTEPEPLPDQAD